MVAAVIAFVCGLTVAHARFVGMRWLSFVIIALSFVIGHNAHADSIDRRAKQLSSSDSYKVRLSAAVWLAKKKDPRAVKALAKALVKEPEKGIRRIAAKALPRLISRRTPESVREKAVAALERAAKKDKDKKVRRRSRRALRKVAALRSSKSSQKKSMAAIGERSSGIFVNIGVPNTGKHKTPRGLKTALQRAVSAQLKNKLPKQYYQLASEQNKLPTKAQLQKQKKSGWFVGATVSSLKVSTKGSSAVVKCGITMRVNPWFGRDGKQRLRAHDTASASGNASVTSANTKREIAYAKQDCLLAVAEQVTASRVAPFLKQKGPVAVRRSKSKSKRVRVSRSRP